MCGEKGATLESDTNRERDTELALRRATRTPIQRCLQYTINHAPSSMHHGSHASSRKLLAGSLMSQLACLTLSYSYTLYDSVLQCTERRSP